MAVMRTDEAALSASASKIQAMAADLKGVLGELQSAVDASKGMWQGTSQGAFEVSSATLHAQLTAGQAKMDEISARAARNSTAYGSTEGDSTSRLSGAGV